MTSSSIKFDTVKIKDQLLMDFNKQAYLPNVYISNTLNFATTAGDLGFVVVSQGPGVSPLWQSPQYFVEYYDNVVVDMNSGGVGGTVLLTSAIPNVVNPNITYNAGVFTLLEKGQYRIAFNTNATTVTPGAQTSINIRIDGTFENSFTTTQMKSGLQAVTLQRSFYLLEGTTIEIVSIELVPGVINTSPADLQTNATTLISITRLGAHL